MQEFEKLVGQLSDFVWGPPLLILLLGTHIFLTFRLRFIQRYLGKAIKLSVQKSPEGHGDISQFGALTTALAATIGTGNIVGVATAIAAGGPGAVLWMWLTGVFGIATKYSEALLSVKYRIKTNDGLMAGGPMYVLERGMKQKWLGVIFAILTAVSAFGIGNMVQANSISAMVNETFRVAPWITGIAMAVLTAFVILGGIKSIARVCEALVPFMAIFYVTGCIVLLLMNASAIPATIQLIFQSAFSGHAMFGGFAGATMKEAIRYGVARGLFSNESGLGSAPIVAAAAQTKKPSPPSPRFFHRNVLGYRRCLCDDRPCVGQLRPMDKGPQRRGPHESRILRFSHRRTNRPYPGLVDICLFHNSWMVVLRRKSCGIPPRAKSDYSLSLDLGWCSDDRLSPFSSDRLVACRCYKRPHGNSKPCFSDCTQWRHRFRNTSLFVERQFRCSSARVAHN